MTSDPLFARYIQLSDMLQAALDDDDADEDVIVMLSRESSKACRQAIEAMERDERERRADRAVP
jgi:predicted translin family RNA/ssDNA-binding protein